jgi:O-antigen/teichoic acid export membrane protein
MSKPLVSEVISSVKVGIILKVVIQILSWVSTIFIIRWLTPIDYSILSFLDLSIAVLLSLGLLGAGPALIRNKTLERKGVESLLGLLLSVNATFCILIIIFSGQIALFFNSKELEELLHVASLLFLINPYINIYSSLFARDMKFKKLEAIQFVATMVTLTSSVSLAYLGYGFWALFIGRLLGVIVQLSLFIYITKTVLVPNLKFVLIKPLFSDAKYNFIAGMVWEVNNKIDRLFISKLLPMRYVGLYSMSYSLTEKPVSMTSIFIQKIGLSSFSSLQETPEKVGEYIVKATSIIAMCFLPVFCGISAVANTLIPIMIGDKWIDAIFAIQVLCFIQMINILKMAVGSALFALGYAKRKIMHACVAFIIFIISWGVGLQGGFNTGCIAYLLGYSLWFFWFIWDSKRFLYFKFTSLMKAIVTPLVISLVMLIIVKTIEPHLNQFNEIIAISIQVLLGVFCYIGMNIVFNKKQIYFVYKTLRNK